MNKKESVKYVIGVDAGGTKTTALLADLSGKVLKKAATGPASPRNDGPEKAGENIAAVIKKVWSKKVFSVFIGAPAIGEQSELKKKLKKEIIKKASFLSKKNVILESDQLVAFRSGTDKDYGILLIAGTGCVVRGFGNKKDVHASSWGWLADEGSAIWVGQKVFQAVSKDLDKRGPKTLLTKEVLKFLKVKTAKQFVSRVYLKDTINTISRFSVICDNVSKKGDRIAKDILQNGALELVLSVKTAIKELKFQRKEFPLVLVGGMFKSPIVLNTVKKEIRKFAPKANIVFSKSPATGAVSLALESIKK